MDKEIKTKCNCKNVICQQNEKLANRFLQRRNQTRITSLDYYHRVVKKRKKMNESDYVSEE